MAAPLISRRVCSSCGAPIIFAVSSLGNNMPVDAEPAPGGNLRLDFAESPPRAKVVGTSIDLLDPTDDGARRYAHHATCPQASERRRK